MIYNYIKSNQMLNYRFTYETIKNIVFLLSNSTNVDLEIFF